MRNKEESLEHTIWSFKEGGGGYFTSDLLGPRKSVIYLSDIIIYPNEKWSFHTISLLILFAKSYLSFWFKWIETEEIM